MAFEDSLDPRVRRLNVPDRAGEEPTKEMEYWEPYEVFRQDKRGGNPVREGTVHAPSPQMALVLAKEQHGRRMKVVNLWVARARDIYMLNPEDDDMFALNEAPEKAYRNPQGFAKVRKKIKSYKTQDTKPE